MTHILAAIAVAITILLGVLADDARGQERTFVWKCTTPIEKALLLDRLPPDCVAPAWLVEEVLRDMGYGAEPSKPAARQCVCPVSCLRAGGCAPGELWDGL